jgi:superfamily I DNA and/or RNA helicase
MVGKDINQNPNVRKKALKRVKDSRLIFTTCIGSGLGLLRREKFDTIIVDEASQQTEPASLIPLIKGGSRVILVGDHVQLRATVRPHAQVLDFDVSLFERLWKQGDDEGA